MTTWQDLFNADSATVSKIYTNLVQYLDVYMLVSANYGKFGFTASNSESYTAENFPPYIQYLQLLSGTEVLRAELQLTGVLSGERTNIIKDATEVSKLQTALGV